MNIIKLNAIDSTNDFLKAMSQKNDIENYTIITAEEQTKGRGQQGSKWLSESGKNLITSILIKDAVGNIESIFCLNITVTVSIIEALKNINIPSLQIKWPNDIMSGNKKIAGILIENLIKENGKIDSIVGIGLNINQINFENLPKASSLKKIMKQDFDIEKILKEIVLNIQKNIQKINNNTIDDLWNNYHEILFRIGKPVVFENEDKEKFMGIIQRVNENGKLEVLLENDQIESYGIKEITMIY